MRMHRSTSFLPFAGLLLATAALAQKPAPDVTQLRTLDQTRAFFHYTPGHTPIISGHRGGDAVGYPENSIPAFENTLRHTPAMFEIDPHLSKDGVPVMMHDATLDRTSTGHGKVKLLTVAEFQQLSLKDYKGNVTSFHPSTLEEVIVWSKGKTVLNLDVKDTPIAIKSELVKEHDAWASVMFTVHNAAEAAACYALDHRSLMAAVVFNMQDFQSYVDQGIPWSNVAIAYVGAQDKPENQPLYEALHRQGVMVMVATSPSYDKLTSAEERAARYRAIVQHGADIIESDWPVEVATALRSK